MNEPQNVDLLDQALPDENENDGSSVGSVASEESESLIKPITLQTGENFVHMIPLAKAVTLKSKAVYRLLT